MVTRLRDENSIRAKSVVAVSPSEIRDNAQCLFAYKLLGLFLVLPLCVKIHVGQAQALRLKWASHNHRSFAIKKAAPRSREMAESGSYII